MCTFAKIFTKMDFFMLYKTLEEYGLEIFTLNDVIKLTGQRKDVVKNTLARLVKQKKIFRLKAGFYSLKEIENKFLFQRLFKDTYVGLYSALEFYGSTTQRFNNLDLISKNILNDYKVDDTKINFHNVKKELFFGYKKVRLSQTGIFVSNIEKTIIDTIYFSSKVYLSEITAFIQMNKEKIDSELLYNYLIKINSSVLNKRVGYMLEKNNIYIENLKINNKYERLNINLGNTGTKNKKWKLIINEDL